MADKELLPGIELQTSKSLFFRCFPYSDVHYSDPHCTESDLNNRLSDVKFIRTNWAKIHQALLSQFSFLAEFFLGKGPIKD